MSEVNHSQRAHSEIGASSAHRWMACPGSVVASRGIEQEESSHASEGTALHEAVDHCINEGIADSSEIVGQDFNGFTVREEDVEHINYCLRIAQKYLNDDGYECYVEERFNLTDIHEDMFGSNDFCALGHNKELDKDELVVIDWKFGRGINVHAVDNIQLVIYALGAYEDYKDAYEFDVVKLAIVQPRIMGEEYDEWVITVDQLLAYKEKLKAGVARVYSDSPEFKAGNHCRFCLNKPTCLKLKETTEDALTATLDSSPIGEPGVLPEVSKMTKEQIIKVLEYSKVIKDWMDGVSEHAFRLAEKGEEIPGFKLVKARTQRKVRSEDELVEAFGETFGDQLYQKKLQTLGNLEKLIGKKELEPFLEKPDKGNQLVPESDKRQAVAPMIDQILDDHSEEDYDDMEF